MPHQWYKAPDKEAEDITLSDVLTEGTLRQSAGGRSFDLGRQYFKQGHVRDLAYDQKTLSATVVGSEAYRVRLGVLEDDLDYDCTCPFAADEGAFCKHCVAAGLAWLKKVQSGESADSLAGIRTYLESLDKLEIVRMLLEQALQNPEFRNALTLRLAAGSVKGTAPDVAALRAAIDRATEVEDYDGYGDAADSARSLDQIVKTIQGILDTGHARDAFELAEYAIDAIEANMEQIDDSEGEIIGVLDDLVRLHANTARAHAMDPEELGRHLFVFEMTRDYARIDLDDYREALGDGGLAEYRRQAENAWDGLNDSNSMRPSSQRQFSRYRLEPIMLRFAKEDGDVEQTVRILSINLSSPDRFVSIARVYADADRLEQAVSWAERGAKTFAGQNPFGLNDLLVTLYRQAGRHDDALAILWKNFENDPSLRTYITLYDYSEPLGRWSEWRDKAWQVLRNPPAANHPSAWLSFGRRDRSLIVRILLWENKDEQAWQEALAGGCSEELWLKLADAREADHPEDTLAIYRQRVEPLIDPVTNGRYEQPIAYLAKINSLMERLNQEREFRLYIATLRETYKRKRNFIKLLDQTFG